jgi:hypothetical protein
LILGKLNFVARWAGLTVIGKLGGINFVAESEKK